MKKIFSFLLLGLLLSIGNAWSETVTFSYGDYKGKGTSSSGSEYTMVKTDIVSIGGTKFYGNNSYAHFYAGGVITITPASGVTVSSVKITASSTSYNGYQSGGTITASTGSMSHEGEIVTWTGSSSDAFTLSNAKQIRWTSIDVTYSEAGGGSQAVNTTVVIDDSGITNTNVYNGVAAGSLSAIVKAGNDAIDGATVVWSGDNDAVATINANTGVVTLVAAGSVTFTASYAGVVDTYNPSNETYEMTVTNTDPNAPYWEETAISDLTSSDIFVIVGNNGNTYALTNNNGTSSSPNAYAVTIADGKISSAVGDNLKWSISGNAEGYTFHPNGNSEKWLYCTNTNNGVRVGTNASKTFVIDGESGYLYHIGTERYVGIQASSDWRCYTSINSTITGQTFAFYKYVDPSAPSVATPEFSPTAGTFATAQNVTITCATENSTIYYTTNGEDPDNTSLVYSAPIAVNASVTIKAIAYVGNDYSDVATAVYNIVTIEHAGTLLDPYSIADAKNVIDVYGTTEGKYVHGIISQIDGYNSTYSSITYWISEDGTKTNQFEVYSGKKLGNTNFAAVSDLTLGDEVVVYGNIKKYNSTYEFDHSNYIVSHKSKLTISSVGYATYFNSANAYTMPENCVGNVFTISGGLEEIYDEGDIVPAGEPLVIYTIDPGTKTLVFAESNAETYAENDLNDLSGTDIEGQTTGGDVYYALSLANGSTDPATVGFYWMAAGGAAFENGAHKAYLALSANQAPARYYLFNEESNATDIQNVEGAENAVKFIENGKLYIQKNGVVYDAMGKTVR